MGAGIAVLGTFSFPVQPFDKERRHWSSQYPSISNSAHRIPRTESVLCTLKVVMDLDRFEEIAIVNRQAFISLHVS
jgi:hypothetical protein